MKRDYNQEAFQISLVMPCYNRAYDLQRVLTAYDQQVCNIAFEIIAVDDGSSDQTYQVLTQYRPQNYSLKVERLDRNQGPAAARNQGIQMASAPLILFVGDDIVPDPFLVQGHLAAHRHYPDKTIAILGKVLWPNDLPVNTLMAHIDGVGAQQFSYHFMKNGQQYDFRHFYTANVSIKREMLFTEDRWFDTDFRFAAFEDAELAYRLSKHGLQITYLSDLVGYHYHYHTAWTFSTRQFRSGLMAVTLSQKHPEIRNKIIGRYWTHKILRAQLQSRLNKLPPGHAEILESRCLHLLNEHEWAPYPQLDRQYIQALRYYYTKGILHGLLGETTQTRQVQNSYADQMLFKTF